MNLRFDECLAAEQVDQVWASASANERSVLLTWQYALVRSSMTDHHRPSKAEVEGIARDIAKCMPVILAARAALFLAGLAVLGWAAISLGAQDSMLRWAIALLAVALAARGAAHFGWTLGPRGKAMRMVWASRLLAADERHSAMRAAAAFDPGKPAANGRG